MTALVQLACHRLVINDCCWVRNCYDAQPSTQVATRDAGTCRHKAHDPDSTTWTTTPLPA